MTPLQIMRLVKEMRDSQRRFPSHPQHPSIETMELERKVDEALDPYILYADSLEAEERPMVGAGVYG